MTGVLVQFLKNRLYAFCVIATAIFLHEMFFVNNSRVYTLSLLLSESYREVNVLRFMYFTLQLIRFIYLCKTCLHTVRDRRILFLFRPNISVVQHSLCSLYANCRILTLLNVIMCTLLTVHSLFDVRNLFPPKLASSVTAIVVLHAI